MEGYVVGEILRNYVELEMAMEVLQNDASDADAYAVSDPTADAAAELVSDPLPEQLPDLASNPHAE